MKNFTTTEDFCAIVLGALMLVAVTAFFLLGSMSPLKTVQAEQNEILKQQAAVPFESVAKYEALEQLRITHGESLPLGKYLKKLTGRPSTWKAAPWRSMVAKDVAVDPNDLANFEKESERLRADALQQEQTAAAAKFSDQDLNAAAQRAAEIYITHRDEAPSGKKGFQKWGWMLLLLLFFIGIFGWAQQQMGFSLRAFAIGFLFVFALAFVCQLLGAQEKAKELGLGYAAWAIVLGLLISNTFGTPEWVKPSLRTELFIKTGLVILGAEILFSKVLAIGLPGIFVAWIVTPIVLISTYWFGQKILKIPSKTLNMTVSADMSVCGVSAAVATAAACRAKKEELTLAIGLSMIFTSVMMIVLPLVIRHLGLPEVLGGAWIGGTIDATGAVVAAGAFLGDTALNVAATIKMIQNILIGIIAFGVAIYFARKEGVTDGEKIGWSEIWKRFPKFILGFIGASLLFSAVYVLLGTDLGYALIDKGVISSWSKNIRGWLFCLAFVSIGLSTNFNELKSHFSGGKPLILYLCGQAFNLTLTLAMAYLMFYVVFPQITSAI